MRAVIDKAMPCIVSACVNGTNWITMEYGQLDHNGIRSLYMCTYLRTLSMLELGLCVAAVGLIRCHCDVIVMPQAASVCTL